MEALTQAQADAIYMQQVQQYENDRRLKNAVYILQGVAAIAGIISAIYILTRK